MSAAKATKRAPERPPTPARVVAGTRSVPDSTESFVKALDWLGGDGSDRHSSAERRAETLVSTNAGLLRDLGVTAAVDAISAIVPGEKIHAAGYCLGGTILAIAAAAMARDGDDRFKSVTLFAAQVDFKDAGELTIFIDEAQLASLDESMKARGVLDASQMVGAFVALRAGDLQWGRGMRRYLLGEEVPCWPIEDALTTLSSIEALFASATLGRWQDIAD